MALQSPDATFVHTDADLYQLWCDLMGSGGFAQRSLWTIFMEEDGRMGRVVVPIDDIAEEPDALLIGNLNSILRDVIEPPLRSAAMLISRPGPAHMTASDRRWARAVLETIDPTLLTWPVHLATRGCVRVFSPDDLIGA